MAYDPLSRSTRVARATFLIVGTSSVAASAFDIQLKSIDSLKIPFPEQTMTIVLGVATVYLFIAFLVAYIDDVRHREAPASLAARGEQLDEKLERLRSLRDRSGIHEARKPPIGDMLTDFPEELEELHLKDEITRLSQAETAALQAGWKEIRVTLEGRTTAEIQTLQGERSSQGWDRFSQFRLYVIDGAVPCVVVMVALAGWLGWLDWIAPLLKVETVAAPLSAPQPPIPAME